MVDSKARYDHPLFWPTLLVLGLFAEVAIWLIARYWATRYGVDAWSLRGVTFGIAVCSVYVGSQILAAAFRIDTVAGLSLTLLATMLAWAGAIAVLLGFAFLIALALYSALAIPGRAAFFTLRRLRKKAA